MDVIDNLFRFANADWDDGWFGTIQQGTSWFGHGAKTFIETAPKQYDGLPGSQSTHHREITTWIGPDGPLAEAMVLSGQARTKASRIDRFTVGLITDGYPITPQFITALDGLKDRSASVGRPQNATGYAPTCSPSPHDR